MVRHLPAPQSIRCADQRLVTRLAWNFCAEQRFFCQFSIRLKHHCDRFLEILTRSEHCIQPEQRRSERLVNARIGTSLIEQELAHFSNDRRFVYYEHVVVGVMQFDES